MRNRSLSMSVAAAVAAALLPMTASAQTQSDGEPLTPWGDPNLQGTWSYASLTPLQRPAGLGDRQRYTEEEAAARNLEVTLDREPPPGSVGSYNALWFDRGRVSPDLRTSLITDPPNGRPGPRRIGRTGRSIRPTRTSIAATGTAASPITACRRCRRVTTTPTR